MKQSIRANMKRVRDAKVILSILPADKLRDHNLHMLDYFLNDQGSSGAYVSFNRPYSTIVADLEGKDLPTDQLFFIDCLSQAVENVHNCVFLGSPLNLRTLETALGPVCTDRHVNFVLFDALGTLMLYHSAQDISTFVQGMVTSMLQIHHKQVIITISDETDEELKRALAKRSDVVLELKNDKQLQWLESQATELSFGA